MLSQSVYVCDCTRCGSKIETAETEVTCAKCGLVIVIQWQWQGEVTQ